MALQRPLEVRDPFALPPRLILPPDRPRHQGIPIQLILLNFHFRHLPSFRIKQLNFRVRMPDVEK